MKGLKRFSLAYWLAIVLLVAGFGLVGYTGWQTWGTDAVADKKQQKLLGELDEGRSPIIPDVAPQEVEVPDDVLQAVPQAPTAAPPEVPALSPVAHGQVFGELQIPRFGADYRMPIIEGTSVEVLKHGVGHHEETARPGQIGNFVVAGHRVTYGRPFYDIDQLTAGDQLVVKAEGRTYTYVVERAHIVTPDQIEVAAPVPDQVGIEPTLASMTIYACHPKHSAKQRYVVHATLQGIT